MKIVHTSDWHFGMRAGAGSYQDCQEYFLQQLYELIRRENVGAVLCAGDVYDSGGVGADAIALFDRAASAICMQLGVPFIVIAGNHDSPERLAAHRDLLCGAGLHITGRLTRDIEPVLLDGGKVAVYPIPYFSRYEAAALFPEEQEHIAAMEDAAMVVCEHIRRSMDPSRRNIVMAHAFVVGAEPSESDRAAQVGFASAVSRDVFRGFDYVALGHIHKPQPVGDNGWYSGCPLKHSFGKEESQTKGVVLIDTEDMSASLVPLPLLRDRKTVEGTFAGLMARDDIRDDYLCLHVTDRYASLETQAQLRERFPYLLEIVGKQDEDVGAASTLTVEELEKLDEADIMVKFLDERFGYTPTAEQIEQFREAMEKAKGGA